MWWGSWLRKAAIIGVTAIAIWWFAQDHEAPTSAPECMCVCQETPCYCMCFEPVRIVGAVVRR